MKLIGQDARRRHESIAIGLRGGANQEKREWPCDMLSFF